MPSPPLIAVVDDDAAVCEAIEGLLKASGFSAETFLSAEDFLRSDRLDEVDCLITDLRLRGMSGPQLQQRLRALGRRLPVIVMTAFPRDGRRALTAGAVCVLGKPVAGEELLASIHIALADRQSRQP